MISIGAQFSLPKETGFGGGLGVKFYLAWGNGGIDWLYTESSASDGWSIGGGISYTAVFSNKYVEINDLKGTSYSFLGQLGIEIEAGVPTPLIQGKLPKYRSFEVGFGGWLGWGSFNNKTR